MNTLSGVALIVAALLLLLASRRACQRCGETWHTSDMFVLSVIGPGAILSLVTGVGMLFYSGGRTGSGPAAIAGLVFAGAITGLAAFEWAQSSRKVEPTARSAEIIALGTKPDAPRPPVTPRKAA